MGRIQARERRMTPAISLQELRRPLRRREQRLPAGRGRDVLNALGRLVEQGDEQAEAVAEALACALICEAMTTRLIDERRGAVPEFIGRIRKAVDAFEANLH